MPGESTDSRALKKRILALLRADDFQRSMEELVRLPARQAVNPLLSLLLSAEENVRWRAVTAIGALVENLAEQDMEGARVIMRRLMWSLNDESGGIGWGAPEVMGEIMARHEGLADEYATMLASYCNEEGNYLEYEPLQRGLMWGLLRLALMRPHRLRDAVPHLRKYLDADDPVIRGLAAWAVGLLGDQQSRPSLQSMVSDRTSIGLYLDGVIRDYTVGDLAAKGVASLGS